MKPKKVFFSTLGCKVNQYETQAMREQFIKNGYSEAGLSDADIVIVNTCTVTSRSDSKSYRLIRRALKYSPPHSQVIVTGCLAETDKQKIYNINGVNLVLENRFKPQIADLIEGRVNVEDIEQGKFPNLRITYFKAHSRAFLKIQDGCNHNCSYCKISLVRGKARSRNIEDVLTEARELINNGYKELVLTGICLGAYGVDLDFGPTIIDVLDQISKLKGKFRIRLSSIEPNYVTQKLLDFIIYNEKMCPHLHLSLQSGDNRILKLMRRPYRIEKVMGIINYLRSRNPDFSFSTDVMVGFSTEDDWSIDNTVKVLRYMQPVRTHVFKFSAREGTAGYNFENNVTSYDKTRWHKKILEVSDQMSLKFRSKFLGRDLNVLIERVKNSKLAGHSDNYIYVKIPTSIRKQGEFVKIKVDKVTKNSTIGKIYSL